MPYLICFVLVILIGAVNGELCYNETHCSKFDQDAKTTCAGAGWDVVCSNKQICTCASAAVTSLRCRSQTDCEISAARMHCASSDWTVACSPTSECTCLQEPTCSTNTDCGSTSNHHCPFHGHWGCHHVGPNRRCSCTWH